MQTKSDATGVAAEAQSCCQDRPARAPSTQPSSTSELIAKYRVGVENFDRRVFELSDEQLNRAFLPDAGVGRWPVRVLLGHIVDAELAYSHRFRRAVAEDNPVVNPWDENAFIDAGLYKGDSIPTMVYVIHTLRRWTSDWLATLGEEQFQRKLLHTERGEMTVHQVLVYATWHLEHHAEFLRKKLDKMLGPAPKTACGPGCGCAVRE
jgi:hypothetical protein